MKKRRQWIIKDEVMISGKYWRECDYLVESANSCCQLAKEDEEFEALPFERSLTNCLRFKLREWTLVEFERERLVDEIVEEILNIGA